MVDMPIKELEQYMGINPKPADFDEYWDKAIAEMKAVDPQISMTKASATICILPVSMVPEFMPNMLVPKISRGRYRHLKSGYSLSVPERLQARMGDGPGYSGI